ncbi:hypothetical protein KEJ14_02125 [Candidatus Bathyarchaeota archaeon]|nr:hypothetical protein [Candidatus Bathyarchaeota archaeon]
MKAIKVIASAVCGVLYGAVGYMIYSLAPITTPGVGVVRFWPSVVIPAVFAVLFGPLVGGLGAAIGIFLSDMAIHGDPLLSLSAGVTSNFIGFYLVGYISRRSLDWAKTLAITSIVLLSTLPVLEYILLTHVSLEAAILFIGLLIASYILMVVIGQLWPRWRSYGIASITGLGVGSTIIGFVVWAYSQIFILPPAVGGGFQIPLYGALIWLVWTFATEIPFLIILGPPILRVCFKAFPSLNPIKPLAAVTEQQER